jgi:hypothetical protein
VSEDAPEQPSVEDRSSQPELVDLRRRAQELLEENLLRVETTPRRPVDPDLVRTEADQAVANVSAAFEAIDRLGLMTEGDRERFFRRLSDISTTSYAPFRGVELERVRVAPRGPEAPGLHLLAAELYADGVILRWLFVAPVRGPRGSDPHDYRPPEAFSLWDDVGTAYTPQGGGWIAGHHLRGDTAFVPRVPGSATKLSIAAGRLRYELDLGRGGG